MVTSPPTSGLGRLARIVAGALTIAPMGFAPAGAGQVSDTFNSSVQIFVGCIVTAADLNFGTVSIITGTETASARVDVQCTGNSPFRLSFDPVRNVGNYNGTMVNGTRSIAYRAQMGRRVGRLADTFTILGTIPAQATPPPGTYIDSRTIYVEF